MTMDGRLELTASSRLAETALQMHRWILTRLFSILLNSTITTQVMRQTPL
jgi:hypothetical protein